MQDAFDENSGRSTIQREKKFYAGAWTLITDKEDIDWDPNECNFDNDPLFWWITAKFDEAKCTALFLNSCETT